MRRNKLLSWYANDIGAKLKLSFANSPRDMWCIQYSSCGVLQKVPFVRNLETLMDDQYKLKRTE